MRYRYAATGIVLLCVLCLLPAPAQVASNQTSRSVNLPPTPAELHDMVASIEAYNQKLETVLRASASPRDRALSTQIPHFGGAGYMPSMGIDGARGAILRKAAEAAPRDHLVQWIWANAAKGASGCDTASSCPNRGRALAGLEQDNAAAWIPAVARANEANDTAAVDDSLAHMAAATHYDDLQGELADAWAEVEHRIPADDVATKTAGAARSEPKDSDPDLVANMTSAHAASVMFSLISVGEACSAAGHCPSDPRRATWCATATRKLASGSKDFGTRLLAASVLNDSSFATAEDHAHERLWMWQTMQYMQLVESARKDPALARRLDLPSTSQLDFDMIKDALLRAKVSTTPPDDWTPPPEPPPPVDCGT